MKANIINADQNSRCQQYGRSDLQADYDLAYRLGSDPNSAADVPYQTVVLPNVKPDTEQILIAMAWSDQQKFEERLTMERLTMAMASNAANGVAHSISPVSSSALSQPVTTK